VKTLVSESPIPRLNDGTEFEESVFLDSAPHAFRLLVGRDKFRLDYILEGWGENGQKDPAPLNVLTAAYAIHLAEVFQLMKRVHSSRAEGRWIISNREEELQEIQNFAEYLIVKVSRESFAGDRARLQGRQINYVCNTREYLYRVGNYEESSQGNNVVVDLDEEVNTSEDE
jgi:hypothetical protein